MNSNNASTPDPVGEGLFWAGIVLCAAAIVVRIVTIVFSFFLSFWQVFALGAATLLSTFFLIAAAITGWRTITDKPFRSDVTIQELIDHEGEDDYFVEPEDKYGRKPQSITPEPSRPSEEPDMKNLKQILLDEKQAREQRQTALLDFPLYPINDLAQQDRYFLSTKGYEEKEFVPFGKTRREQFLILKQKNYALEHTFVLYSLLKLLQDRDIFTRVTADSILQITHAEHKHAICVVTPTDHSRTNYLYLTSNRMHRHGISHFLTTSSAYQRSFTHYAETLTRNTIHQWIKDTFPPSPPLPL